MSSQLVSEIRSKIAKAQAEPVQLRDLDDRADADAIADAFPEAVTLDDLEHTLLSTPGVAAQLSPHPNINGAWQVKGQTRSITFDRKVLADHSPDVRLLAPGDPLFDLVIERASEISRHRYRHRTDSQGDSMKHDPRLKSSAMANR